MPDSSEQAAVLALVARTQLAWHWAGALIEEAGGAKRLLAGDLGSVAWFNRADAEALARAVELDEVARCAELAAGLAARGVGLVTVLDDDYPATLHAAYDRPPFLFTRGPLAAAGDCAIAIAGGPGAGPEDLECAADLAGALTRQEVAVAASPRDALGAAALGAALEAGGHAVAVLDAGIDHLEQALPAELQPRLATTLAAVSPLWPDARPDPASELHAATLSGLALGLVVVDGVEGSPAQRQAHRCLDQARRLFLLRPLVLRESWAKHYADHPGATVVDAVGEILEVVAAMVQLRAQLSAMT
jgi:DNA processing protein